MEQNSSLQAKSSSASKEIPRILRNLNVHFRTDNSPLPVLVLSKDQSGYEASVFDSCHFPAFTTRSF
jgi:hypothetical protein